MLELHVLYIASACAFLIEISTHLVDSPYVVCPFFVFFSVLIGPDCYCTTHGY